MVYRLRANLEGHSSDVRAIAVSKDGVIVSGSRDKTSCVWRPNEFGQYSEVACLVGHDNFISAVCFLEPNEDFPIGAIITGSHDCTINVYSNEKNPRIDFVLVGHSSVVCCLALSATNHLLSASWDNSVRRWNLLTRKTIAIYEKHPMAVWAVIDQEIGVVTGCADKVIRVFAIEGTLIRNLTGHTDCVRALARTASPNIFLSCGNDALIIRWNAETGSMLNTFYGHPNYIYCLATNHELSVSGGEDGILKIWRGTDLEEDLHHPDQSVWCVAILPNGDIVTGGSDGIVRIFTTSEERGSSEEVTRCFAEKAAIAAANRHATLGGYKVTELPGRSALNTPGRVDGQVTVINEDGVPKCFSWSSDTKQWNFVGEVMGSAGARPGKSIYYGREYDYVFSIDVEGYSTPLKLPYNNNEDPWAVAQAFIHKYSISQSYLEEIANFIIKNASPSPAPPKPRTRTGLSDPLTGASRYIPGEEQPKASSSNNESESRYYPHLTYIQFDMCDYNGMARKLSQFSRDLVTDFTEAQIERIVGLTKVPSGPLDQAALFDLENLLQWPPGKILPVLDVIRMVMRNPLGNTFFCQGVRAGQLKSILLSTLQTNSVKNNVLMSLRIISNMFCGKDGEHLALQFSESVLDCLPLITFDSAPKSFEMATATCLFNYIVAARKNVNMSVQYHALQIIELIIPRLQESEAKFRVMVGLGNILTAPNSTSLSTFPILEAMVQEYSNMTVHGNMDLSKVIGCCKQILNDVMN